MNSEAVGFEAGSMRRLIMMRVIEQVPSYTFACKGSSLITRFTRRSPRCDGRRATGAVWNF